MAGRGDSILAHPSLKCLPPEDILIYKVAQSCGNSASTPFWRTGEGVSCKHAYGVHLCECFIFLIHAHTHTHSLRANCGILIPHDQSTLDTLSVCPLARLCSGPSPLNTGEKGTTCDTLHWVESIYPKNYKIKLFKKHEVMQSNDTWSLKFLLNHRGSIILLPLWEASPRTLHWARPGQKRECL